MDVCCQGDQLFSDKFEDRNSYRFSTSIRHSSQTCLDNLIASIVIRRKKKKKVCAYFSFFFKAIVAKNLTFLNVV